MHRLELFSRGGDPKAPLGRVFEFPAPGLPAGARVFGLIHSQSPDVTGTVSNLVRNAIVRTEPFERRTLQTGLEGRFESILLALNRGYAELATSGALPVQPLPDILVGLLVNGDVFLSGRGKIIAYLFRPAEASPRNLFAEGETARNGGHLFRTITSGTLRSDDTLIVTVSTLFDYLAVSHLGRVISSMPAAQARARILELLGDAEQNVCISGVIVGAPSREEKEKDKSPVTAALPRLRKTTDAGSLLGTGAALPDSGGRPGKWLSFSGRGTLRALLAIIFSALKASAGNIWLIFRNKSHRKASLNALRSSPDRAIDSWNRLPRRSRFILLAGVISALLFGESLRFLYRARAEEQRILSYNNAVRAVQERRDAAEASLIYKDEDRAWMELDEAERLVRSLPGRTESEQRTAADLRAQIEQDREKLRHVTYLDSLSPLAALPEGSGVGVTLMKGRGILTLVTDTGGAWNWDTDKKTLSRAIEPFLIDGVVERAFPGTRSPLYFTGKSLAERQATSTVKAALTLPGGAEPTAAQIWNGRLYALSTEANQIYRGTKGKDSWLLSSGALKDADVRDATDLAIDGEIWVSEPTKVKRYLKGVDQGFGLKRYDPLSKHFSRIWTSAETDFLALYDDQLDRFYLFSKDGDLRAQYAGGPLANLRDAAFDQKSRKLWILTEKELFETSLPET